MKFKKNKFENLMGGVEVHFTEERPSGDATLDPFTIVATREGLHFYGKSGTLDSYEALNVLAKTISLAWNQHKNLVPKIVETMAGH